MSSSDTAVADAAGDVATPGSHVDSDGGGGVTATGDKPKAAAALPDFEPPAASVNRIVKAALPENCQITKEAKAAFSKAAGIFIVYLTSCANDFCRESKRSTISSADIAAALKELEFHDLAGPLEDFLARKKPLHDPFSDSSCSSSRILTPSRCFLLLRVPKGSCFTKGWREARRTIPSCTRDITALRVLQALTCSAGSLFLGGRRRRLIDQGAMCHLRDEESVRAFLQAPWVEAPGENYRAMPRRMFLTSQSECALSRSPGPINTASADAGLGVGVGSVQ